MVLEDLKLIGLDTVLSDMDNDAGEEAEEKDFDGEDMDEEDEDSGEGEDSEADDSY
jgi:hypothetical protein